jgi:hypothetical protein
MNAIKAGKLVGNGYELKNSVIRGDGIGPKS